MGTASSTTNGGKAAPLPTPTAPSAPKCATASKTTSVSGADASNTIAATEKNRNVTLALSANTSLNPQKSAVTQSISPPTPSSPSKGSKRPSGTRPRKAKTTTQKSKIKSSSSVKKTKTSSLSSSTKSQEDRSATISSRPSTASLTLSRSFLSSTRDLQVLLPLSQS